jgi:superfamily II DNA or RNA helicase
MSDVVISKKNEVYIKLECEPHILFELQQHFTFEVDGAKFMPQMRSKHWDGKIRLLSTHTGEIYAGLLDKIIEKIKLYNYTYEFKNNNYYGLPFEVNDYISEEGVKDYVSSICNLTPRSYQLDGIYHALRYNRKLLLSPTASGKSLMIYCLVRYYVSKEENILLVVPTTSLVEQMTKDFSDYGWNSDSFCHKIYSGRKKDTNLPVTITTWQSIYKMPKSFFERFTVVIGDEAHLFKSKSLISIMTKLHHTKYRFGFTGTLDGSQTHKWVMEGIFGPSYNITKTSELIEKGYLSK